MNLLKRVFKRLIAWIKSEWKEMMCFFLMWSMPVFAYEWTRNYGVLDWQHWLIVLPCIVVFVVVLKVFVDINIKNAKAKEEEDGRH